jgi:hypothetical protein
VTLSRTIMVAVACSAVFGGSYAVGQAILDDADDTQERPTRSAPPVDSHPPSDDSRLEVALGRAADLPGLRTPSRPAKESSVWAPGPAAPPGSAPQPVPPTPAAPAPDSQPQPVNTPTPRAPSPPPARTPEVASPRPRPAAPAPDAPPSPPRPSPDPAPSGGAPYADDD